MINFEYELNELESFFSNLKKNGEGKCYSNIYSNRDTHDGYKIVRGECAYIAQREILEFTLELEYERGYREVFVLGRYFLEDDYGTVYDSKRREVKRIKTLEDLTLKLVANYNNGNCYNCDVYGVSKYKANKKRMEVLKRKLNK